MLQNSSSYIMTLIDMIFNKGDVTSGHNSTSLNACHSPLFPGYLCLEINVKWIFYPIIIRLRLLTTTFQDHDDSLFPLNELSI